MKKYLATIHTKSDRHKHAFALGVSGGFTLLIFAVWAFVRFGPAEVITQEDARPQLAAATEVSPLESIGDSLSSAWEELKESFKDLGDTMKGLEGSFEDMKEETLDTYGR